MSLEIVSLILASALFPILVSLFLSVSLLRMISSQRVILAHKDNISEGYSEIQDDNQRLVLENQRLQSKVEKLVCQRDDAYSNLTMLLGSVEDEENPETLDLELRSQTKTTKNEEPVT